MVKKNRFPMQPLVWKDDIIRFRENRIVSALLDAGPIDMNMISMMPEITREEHEQFAQLIGYSVSSFGDLSYASDRVIADADKQAEEMLAQRKRRDAVNR